MSAFLNVSHISKHFGGVAALNDCSLSLGKGRVTGIIGPNGAGKTTLLNVITGLEKPDSGSIAFDGHDVTGLPMHRIASLSLVRTFQIVRELRGLTVFENLLLSPPHQVGENVGGAGGLSIVRMDPAFEPRGAALLRRRNAYCSAAARAFIATTRQVVAKFAES